ncbi:MAG TPA: HEAT repeat domain-containing protein, partial [Pirellulales bacterium]|nr:HEAT repeat domain-containing protein [Pirellulales bacterium]
MDVIAGRGGYRWIVALMAVVAAAPVAWAEVPPGNVLGEPEWIWSAAVPKDRAPLGACYFRKTFDASNAESARIQISCDDRYELFVNGRSVGTGSDWHVMQSFDITKFLTRGPNVIAVKAENTQGSSAGLVARVTVKARGTTEVSHSTDNTWVTRSTEVPSWQRAGLNDSSWVKARTLGEFGATAPWGDQVQTNDGSQSKRFSVTRDFRVERVVAPQQTGSAIAMAFNEWGEILLSAEDSPLLLVIDKDKDNVPDTAVEYCKLVKNVQGILPLNGDVFVIADGPQGAGLYRLTDDDQDGQAENAKALFGFEGAMGEHGPHALALGPEGMIYVMIGNHSSVKRVEADDTSEGADAGGKSVFSRRSPYQHWYEGDLLEPKYEDANGHAVGIKAPCGTVVRTDAEGRVVQLVAGGLRNAYDMVFNKDGELFTYDSDMEWDMGLPWYRPTRIYHVVPGAEFGSRSGWSPWPEYYLDGLPPSLETGRGSPTGIEVYTHHAYPSTYYNAMFACDWSQGRILVIRTKPMGGSYEVDGGVFLEGRPLNVTDIAVGPDGCVYFCTGGRGTEGGVYRVVYTGKVPQQPKYTPLQQAIRQPQMNAAWARQKVALIQQKYTKEWNSQLPTVALETKNVVDDRMRAMDMMQLYGPAPDAKMLTRLAKDSQAQIRAKAAFMIGTHSDASYVALLEQLLNDKDPLVRRMTCEAIVRGGYKVDAQAILPLLADSYRFVGWAARRAIQTAPQGQWRAEVVESKNIRLFLDGSTALLALDADRATCESVVEQARVFMRGYVSDDDFVDLMRVVSLALKRGDLKGNDLPQLRAELAREYPCGEARMNRELIRVLAYLDEPSVIPAILRELSGKASEVEKLHAALCARFITRGWTTDQRLALLEFYEQVGHQEGGHSFAGYIENISKDFFAQFDDDQ